MAGKTGKFLAMTYRRSRQERATSCLALNASLAWKAWRALPQP